MERSQIHRNALNALKLRMVTSTPNVKGGELRIFLMRLVLFKIATDIRKNPFGWQSASYPVQHVPLSRTFLMLGYFALVRSRGNRSILDAVVPFDQSDVAKGNKAQWFVY